MEDLSLREKWTSQRNQLFWQLRSKLRFQRPGYAEKSGDYAVPIMAAKFAKQLRPFADKLAPRALEKNLHTLWMLETMGVKPTVLQILEPGCQDFSRLPALATFFSQAEITGLEIDPYPILSDLHSRADKAAYYQSLLPARTAHYQAGDFFHWQGGYDLLLCFYPFVSLYPALAWGLPARYGSAASWIESILRTLKVGGEALLVHQGPWEEESFDEARAALEPPLRLLRREVLTCPFYAHPYPVCASLYRREASASN